MRKETLIDQCIRENTGNVDGCWIWPGNPATGGYGQTGTTRNGKLRMFRAHRAVYERLVGRIPAGAMLDHLCRNRICVNPRHLQPVSARVNNIRGRSPTAENARKTACCRGHAFTKANTFITREGWRKCRICHLATQAERTRRYMERKLGRPIGVHQREWTHCKHGHEFTPENTARKPNGWRRCRACTRQRSVERRRRERAARVHVPPP